MGDGGGGGGAGYVCACVRASAARVFTFYTLLYFCCCFFFRKFAKFILVLIPLFGIMYIVLFIAFPAHHVDSGDFNVVYLYIEMGYNSFQVTYVVSDGRGCVTRMTISEKVS